MANISTYLANAVLDHVLGRTSYSAPTTLYVALLTSAPGPSGGGTEVSTSGTGYARLAVVNNTTNFPGASAGSKANGAAFNFPFATTGWGTVTHVAVYDAPTGGNLLFFDDLATPRTVNADDAFTFQATSGLVWSLS